MTFETGSLQGMVSDTLVQNLSDASRLSSTDAVLPPRSEAGVTFTQLPTPDGMPNPSELAGSLWKWYLSGYRGCAFNKVAAAMALKDNFTWQVPVEYASADDIVHGSAGERVLANFDSLIADGEHFGLVSYMFPGIQEPGELAKLVVFLKDQPRFRMLPGPDYLVTEYADAPTEFIGIKFRIAVGEAESGETAWAWPMIYNPWDFTTPARRFPDSVHITFNRRNKKNNPHTVDTMIGVDDIEHEQISKFFSSLMNATMRVREIAHGNGKFDRPTLFRARNALVLPAEVWHEVYPRELPPAADVFVTDAG